MLWQSVFLFLSLSTYCHGLKNQRLASRAADFVPVIANDSASAYAEAWFRAASIKPKSVSSQMIQELFDTHTAERFPDDGKYCSIIQVIDNKVYTQNVQFKHKWNWCHGRMLDVAYLLQQASTTTELPDVEMLACYGDWCPRFNSQVPVLCPMAGPTREAIDRRLEASDHPIPVPMLARRRTPFWLSDEIEALRSGSLYPPVEWPTKRSLALFRGHREMDYNASGELPALDSPLFRSYLGETLGHTPPFDIRLNELLDEAEFENYMIVLIIGNWGGWSDRTVRTFFKSSAAMFIDQGVAEWYAPGLRDGVNCILSGPSISEMKFKVETALSNSESLREIVSRQNKFAQEHFSEEFLAKYMASVVQEYAQTLSFSPTLRDDMKLFTSSARNEEPPDENEEAPPSSL